MSRFLSHIPKSQTVIPKSRTLIPSLFTTLRNHTNRPKPKFELIEVDLGSEDSSRSETDILNFQRLHEAIQAILVRRAAPDWIVFMPGSSYWIPPMAKNLKEDKVERDFDLENAMGWPSFSYFVEGVLPNVVDDSQDKGSDFPEKVTHNPEKRKNTREDE